jgi:hypothetical protein
MDLSYPLVKPIAVCGAPIATKSIFLPVIRYPIFEGFFFDKRRLTEYFFSKRQYETHGRAMRGNAD